MKTRPKIKLQLSALDKILEISSRLVMILLWFFAVFAFVKMPDTIPTHFNAAGQVDNYGNKGTIFILPVIGTIVFLGLTILNRYPHIFNYPNEITEANAAYQYTIATRMMRILKLMIAILFTIIVSFTFLTSLHITKGLGNWFLPIFEVLIFIPTIYAITVFYRRKRHEKKSRI